MENLKIKNRYLKLFYGFRIFIICIKAAFYGPDYQKFLMCPLIKRFGRSFVSKNAAESLKHSDEFFKYSAELLKHSVKLLRV